MSTPSPGSETGSASDASSDPGTVAASIPALPTPIMWTTGTTSWIPSPVVPSDATTVSPIPAAAGVPTKTCSTVTVVPITNASGATVSRTLTITNPLIVLATNSPIAASTSSTTPIASSAPTTQQSSKAGSGSIVGGIVGALLAFAALFALFFFVRRNRRKKAAMEDTFDPSHFRKASVRLEDAVVNTIQSPSPLPALMVERHVELSRSPSFESYEYVDVDTIPSPSPVPALMIDRHVDGFRASSISRCSSSSSFQDQALYPDGDIDQHPSENMYDQCMGGYGQPSQMLSKIPDIRHNQRRADLLPEQQYLSYFSSPSPGPPLTPTESNPFIVSREDVLAAGVKGYEDSSHGTPPTPPITPSSTHFGSRWRPGNLGSWP